jgi:hypothetical protein
VNEQDQFHSQVKLLLEPALIADGFRASGTTYRRKLGEVIQVIALQGSVQGGQCCVCLGIHLTFFPGDVDASQITEPDCEFRTRLAPPGQADLWWSYGATEQEARASAESILWLYREVGVPYFQSFSTFPDDFIRVTPAMLACDTPLPFPGRSTEVRRALALSRIALHAGRITDAKQFAEFGLARVGRAIGLKNEFRKILAIQ